MTKQQCLLLSSIGLFFFLFLGCGGGSTTQCNSGQLHSQLELDLQNVANGTCTLGQTACYNLLVTDYTNYCTCINSPNNAPNEAEVALIIFNIQDGSETVAQEATCD